jgi:hypothetical protein
MLQQQVIDVAEVMLQQQVINVVNQKDEVVQAEAQLKEPAEAALEEIKEVRVNPVEEEDS